MIDTQRLNSWLTENKITTKELAGILGITPTAVSLFRNGKNQMRLSTLKLLLEAYPGLCARWLLTGEGQACCQIKDIGQLMHDNNRYVKVLEEHVAAKDEIISLLKKQIEEMKSWRIVAPPKTKT